MDNWQPKLGNKLFRPRRLSYHHLKRSLGVLGLFSAGYGDVGSSIYYGLGVVALAALGFAPIALIIAGFIYIANALSYAEGGAMIPEAGGSASFARHAFNDLIGFISGWALMLSYVVTMAISSYTIPAYLSHFWPILSEPVYSTFFSMGIILLLMLINILGVRESSRLNLIFIIMDISTQTSLIILGIIFVLSVNPVMLIQHMFGPGNTPTIEGFVMGIALGALCFTGVETVSQLAEETRKPAVRIPRAYVLMIFVVMILFSGISITALSVMTPQLLGDPINGWAKDPIAGIAASIPNPIVNMVFEPLVAILAAGILLTATNAGMMGISRLAFNMSKNKLMPDSFARIHHRFRTPYVALFFFCIVVIFLLTPGFYNDVLFVDLGSLYVFGSLLCFAFAHAAILGLRITRPNAPRPFKLRFNLKLGKVQLPATALFGLVATVAVWVLIIITQPFSRWVGFIWMFAGFLVFYVFRRIKRIPLISKKQDDKKESSG